MRLLHPGRTRPSDDSVRLGAARRVHAVALAAVLALSAAGLAGPALLAPALVGPAWADDGAHGYPGKVSDPGFTGWVLSDGRQLGVAELADGTKGICFDAGVSSWPSGTTTPITKTNARVGAAISHFMAAAKADATEAAALWAVVGKDLGMNSAPSYMSASIEGFHREFPGAAEEMESDRSAILAWVAKFAPDDDGYAVPGGFSVQLDDGSTTAGTVDHPGVKSAAGNWVDGAAITLTLVGDARWLPDAEQPSAVTISGDGATMTFDPDRSENAALASDGTVKKYRWVSADGAAITAANPVRVKESITRLANSQYKLQPSIGGTQRVGFNAGQVSLKDTEVLAGAAPPAALVPLGVDKRTDGSDPGDRAGMVGVTVTVHQSNPAGPVPAGATHTFTAADVLGTGAAAHAHWDFPAIFDPGHDWWVVISTEPNGFTPEAGTRAKLAHAADGDDDDQTQPLVSSFTDFKVWTPALATQVDAQEAERGSTLIDHVQVSGTGAHPTTGDWQLLGPVAPARDGSCEHLDWAGAKVAGSGTFAITGDGSYKVGSTRVAASGCYTYIERSEADDYLAATAWTVAGAATETSSVRSQPALHTRVQRRLVTAGSALVDVVAVTGTQGVAVPGQWRVLGPIAARRNGSCEGLDWSAAPFFAGGLFTALAGDGSYRIDAGPAKEAGCYVFEERVVQTHATTGTDWTTPAGEETVTVKPRPARIPRHPHIDTGLEGVADPARVAGRFVRLPGARFRSALVAESFHGSTLRAPAGLRSGGLWTGGAALDAVAGTTLVFGHVSDAHDSPAVFSRLNQARRGQIVTTYVGGHRQRWRIVSIDSVDRRRLPRSLFRQTLQRRLELVTCTGELRDASSGRFHYTRNRIVTAVPIR
ncbi:class F sortase [Nocardioides sp. BP30]|uniref:class F sortase n=1 Tax=Nocardioides sp. BP30 TaxID=3036374 RepID=UPI0024693FAB|nr:class F sortase [Nocardioides sp. BP30]WGL52339.1 class F sortase [Nocardioides sp. BP30]